jgi:hypothetical protein
MNYKPDRDRCKWPLRTVKQSFIGVEVTPPVENEQYQPD